MLSYYPAVDFLPHDVFAKLQRSEIRTLRYLFGIFRIKRKSITLKHATIWPGQKVIAKATGLSLWTVSRAVVQLEKLNLLHKRQSKMADNSWGYNRYWLPRWMVDLWKGGVDKEKRCDIPRLRPDANKEYLESNMEDHLLEIRQIRKMLSQKLGFPGKAPGS